MRLFFSARVFALQTGRFKITRYFSTYHESTEASKNEYPSFVIDDKVRTVPLSEDLQEQIVKSKPQKLPNQRLLKVAILGVPNAGKSTLVNQLTSWTVCAVSSKVHTTRRNAKTVYVEGDTQLVFLDTPGLVSSQESRKHSLEGAFLTHPERAMSDSDLILVLHDISNKFTQSTLSPKIRRLLQYYPEKQSILVLNKADAVKEKRQLLDHMFVLTDGVLDGKPLPTRPAPPKLKERVPVEEVLKRIYQKEQGTSSEQSDQEKVGWPHFSTVFMVSALQGDGVQELRNYLIRKARLAPWLHHPSMVTDQSPHELAMAAVREKLMNHLPNEVPYNIRLEVEHWDVGHSGALTVVVQVNCPTKRIAKLVVGQSGTRVRQLAQESEQSLRDIFRVDVRLRLSITPSPSS